MSQQNAGFQRFINYGMKYQNKLRGIKKEAGQLRSTAFKYDPTSGQIDFPTMHNLNHPDLLRSFLIVKQESLGKFSNGWIKIQTKEKGGDDKQFSFSAPLDACSNDGKLGKTQK